MDLPIICNLAEERTKTAFCTLIYCQGNYKLTLRVVTKLNDLIDFIEQ